jgi:hypothetical protein
MEGSGRGLILRHYIERLLTPNYTKHISMKFDVDGQY